jgi:antitoxin ParD1/3/4
MTITLTPEQHKWIAEHVARGEFPSVEDAVRELLDFGIAEYELDDDDDLAWAKADVEEGIAAIERGDFVTLDEFKKRNAARLEALKR